MTCQCGVPGCSSTAAYDPAPVPVYVQVSSPEEAAHLEHVKGLSAGLNIPVREILPPEPRVPAQRTCTCSVRHDGDAAGLVPPALSGTRQGYDATHRAPYNAHAQIRDATWSWRTPRHRADRKAAS